MDAAAVGLISAGATFVTGGIGSWVLWLTSRSSQRRAQDAEDRREEAERRAQEADRLNEELGRWHTLYTDIQADVVRLREAVNTAKVNEDQQRERANRLQERLDAKTRDLELAQRHIDRLKARLGEG